MITLAGFTNAQVANEIELDPLGGGSESNTRFEDETTITIDAGGVISTPGTATDDWGIVAANTGTVTLAGAQNKTFKIYLKGIAVVDSTDDENLGDITTQGGVDRAGAGDLGIRQGSVNGIENGEGYVFGFDASNFDASVSIQITGISVSSLSTMGEQVTFVNRLDTSKKIELTSVGGASNGFQDLSSLDLYIRGGINLETVVSAFGSDASSTFRIDGIRFKIVDSTTLPNIWVGRTTDFGDTQNWLNNALPTDASNVTIQNYNNEPVIFASDDFKVNNLNIAKGTDLEMRFGATLIVDGTSTGDVSYRRDLSNSGVATEAWYLMGSPVSGVTFDDTFVANNDIAISGDGDRGVATYNTGSTGAAAWTYLASGGSIPNMPGIGYSIKIDPDGNSTAPEVGADGRLFFTGTINTTDISPTLNNGNGFYLLANPYTSFVDSGVFLGANGNLDAQIWLWDQSSGNYGVQVSGNNFMLAPGQGFFAKLNSGTSVTFAETNQAVRPGSGDTFQKTSRTEVKLLMNDGASNRFAKFYYLDNATTGFDYGWEGETFSGIKNSLDVFSHLVNDNQGKNYQLQSLPKSDIDNMVISIGVTAEAGKEITFSTENINFPEGLKVYLEDKLTNTITRLDEANSTYKVVINDALDGVGRFYLHTKSGALSTINVDLENISMYVTNSSTLRVVGLSQGKANIKLFSILGKEVMNSSFESSGVKDIALSKLTTGIYLVQLETEKGNLTKKIILE
jgi:hypothetical protein